VLLPSSLAAGLIQGTCHTHAQQRDRHARPRERGPSTSSPSLPALAKATAFLQSGRRGGGPLAVSEPGEGEATRNTRTACAVSNSEHTKPRQRTLLHLPRLWLPTARALIHTLRGLRGDTRIAFPRPAPARRRSNDSAREDTLSPSSGGTLQLPREWRLVALSMSVGTTGRA
jgi:hypothetical protein